MLHPLRAKGATAGAVVGALALATALAAPLAASAADVDASQTGGAARHTFDQTDLLRDSIAEGPAKNVILLIGDGMGDSEITVARNYQYGAGGELPGLDALPLTGQYTTYSLYREGALKGKPDYVPDSAATGSAWSTGTKTYDNAISVDIDQNPHDTLLEIARANGLKTGDVSTAEIQDATPAVQVAHVDARSCYGPDSTTCGNDALTAGGLGSISEQLLDARPVVTLGGGAASFTQTAKAGQWQGDTLFAQAEDRGYQVVRDAAGLDAITAADQTQPVLGLFSDGNFPTRFAATPATVGGASLPPVTCTPSADALADGLRLPQLTTKAIELLDRPDSEKGFFLQVEGASIDKQDHAANACGQIGETLDFDEAVQEALAFAEADGHTMVIVTADHGHSAQIVDSTPPTSLSVAVTTQEGSPMLLSWGTAALGGSQQHTGTQVRIAAYGPGAANVVGLTDQTDTFFTMAGDLELERDLASLSAGATIEPATSTVAPDATVTVTGKGFNGDRLVDGTADGVALGHADSLDGNATFEITAPTEPGTYTVTLTGRQTGVTATATFTVAAVQPGTGGTGDGGAGNGGTGTGGAGTGTGTGGTTGTGSGAGTNLFAGLASTGVMVAPYAIAGLLLAAAGTLILVRRRRHHTV